jgi:nicotinamide riboside kinase
MFKILVTGAFSTGKTTLVHRLERDLFQRHTVTTLPDIARQASFPMNKNQDENATLWLLTKQVSNELEMLRRELDILICDRGVPDILAHHEEVRARSLPTARSDLLRPFLFEWCKTYDLTFLLKIDVNIPTEVDQLRVANDQFREEMQALSEKVLAEYALQAKVLSTNPQRQLGEALGIIEERLKTP